MAISRWRFQYGGQRVFLHRFTIKLDFGNCRFRLGKFIMAVSTWLTKYFFYLHLSGNCYLGEKLGSRLYTNCSWIWHHWFIRSDIIYFLNLSVTFCIQEFWSTFSNKTFQNPYLLFKLMYINLKHHIYFLDKPLIPFRYLSCTENCYKTLPCLLIKSTGNKIK